MTSKLHFEKLEGLEKLDDCLGIRRIVFIEGQDVPEDLEIDGLDETSHQFLVTENKKPVATARVRIIDGVAKVERVAVLSEMRGKNVGLQLMNYILNSFQDNDTVQSFKLGSQEHAMGFYEKLGFEKYGKRYMDAGIPHYDMVLDKDSVN